MNQVWRKHCCVFLSSYFHIIYAHIAIFFVAGEIKAFIYKCFVSTDLIYLEHFILTGEFPFLM